jgi:nitroreductase
MNETIKVIKSRRSHRKYKPEPLNEVELQAIVEAAIYAPSAMNQQRWHFTVISNKGMMDKLMSIIRENVLNSGIEMLANRAREPEFHVFHHAPAIVIVTAEENARFTEIDCGAAAENIALAAESMNIGSCMVAMSEFLFVSENAGEIKKELGIPENYRHVITVTLGYKEGETPPAPPKKKENINYIK